MVFQEQNLIPNLYIYENVFLSHENNFKYYGLLDRKTMIAKTEKYLDDFELNVDVTKPLNRYSFHERQVLEIIRAFIISDLYKVDTPLILLDEPTAALSDEEREILIEKIRGYSNRAIFLFISHRLSELMSLCDRIAILKDGRFVGEVSPLNCTESDIHSLMVGRKLSEDLYRIKEQKESKEKEEIVLKVENLSTKGEYEDINFDLRKGEILGIGGLVGCGKKELGEILFGIGKFDTGKIIIKGTEVKNVNISKMMNYNIGYVPAERKEFGIIYILSVGWNTSLPSIKGLKNIKSPFLSKKKEDKLVDSAISKFKVKARKSDACYSLSGGNQQKVALAKWMIKNLDILILDNPTRGIDVGAKEEIYTFIREMANNGLSIILITDDLLELIGLSNRIIIMREGKILNIIDAEKDSKPSEKELVKHMV
jgi:ribose transport system ATP-binding protein